MSEVSERVVIAAPGEHVAAPIVSSARNAESEKTSGTIVWGALAGVLLLAMALRVAAWGLQRDFWIDEAMLYAAINAASALKPWEALPLFEQSCPYFLAVLWRMLLELFGPNELLLRLPSVLASMGSLVALAVVARQRGLGPMGIGAALAMAGFSEVAIVQSAQLKQYSFELLATTLILLTAERALRQVCSGRLPVSFLVISILMVPISYAAPIITAACALTVLLAAKLPSEPRISTAGARQPTKIGWLALLAMPWAVSVLLWHRYAVVPSTYFQFTAYPYAQYFLALADPATWRHLAVTLAPLKPHLGTVWMSDVAVPCMAIAWMCGIAVGWQRHLFVHALAFAVMSLLVGLSLAHLLPLAASRHFLFAMPVFALSFGAAMQALFTSAAGRRQRTVGSVTVFGSVLGLILTSGLLRPAEVPGEEVRKALVSAPGQRCHTIWTYYGAWPAVLVYRPMSDARFLGEIASQSTATGWMAAMRDRFPEYVRDTRNLLAEQPEVCLLFSHAREAERAQLVAAINVSHACNVAHDGMGVSLYECRRRIRSTG